MSKGKKNSLPPDPEGQNDDRAIWARAAVKTFQSTDLLVYEDLVIARNVAPNVKAAIEKVCKAVNVPVPFIGTVINYGDTSNASATTMYGKPALLVTPGLAADPIDRIEGTIAHELGHIVKGHITDNTRMLHLLRGNPDGFREASYKAEYEADNFAAVHGFGDGLAKSILAYGGRPSTDHPGAEDRAQRIHAAMTKVTVAA